MLPEAVIGEGFTKLRYDKRVSGRRDARPALAIFALVAAAPDLFEVRGGPVGGHRRAQALLARYADQAFSYVDALVLLVADDDERADEVLTVDGPLATYGFSHSVRVNVAPR